MTENKILMVAPSWLGDMVMSQALVQQLIEQSPHCEIHVLAPPATQALAERMPGVFSSVTSPFAHGELNLPARFALAREIKKQQFEQAIILPNSFKSAIVPWCAGIKKRTGWKGEFRYGLINDLRVLDKAAIPLMVDRFYALGLPALQIIGQSFARSKKRPRLTSSASNFDQLRTRFSLSLEFPVIAFCPGAEYGPSKQWPAEYFSTLASGCMDAGYDVWLLGSRGDMAISQEIENRLGSVLSGKPKKFINLCGQTSLLDAVDLIDAADVAVSNDSGLMHIACAVDTPVVSIYGSTTPEFTPPLSENVRVLQSDISCRPCFERVCPLGHMECLRSLTPQLAVGAVNSLLAENSR
jgi:heptosyltransferase-2